MKDDSCLMKKLGGLVEGWHGVIYSTSNAMPVNHAQWAMKGKS